MAAYLYDFNGTDTSSGVPVPTGHPVLVAVSGSWRRLSNRAYTSTDRNSSPILAAAIGGGDVDLTVDVSSGGGDAVYFRVTDADNWIRARIRRYTTSSTYYYTEYEWMGTTTTADGHTHTYTRWSSSSNNSPFVNAVSHNHDSYGYHTHSETQANSWLTGNTRQSSNTSTSVAYQVIVEKCVAGTITTLQTASISAPSKLRARAQGTSVQVYINGATTPAISVTESAFTTANQHGIGRGPSDQDGQALDNLYIDPLNTPPAAPTLGWPTVVDANSVTRFPHTFNDSDPGDSQSKFDVQYWEVDATDQRVGAATTVTIVSPNRWWEPAAGTFTAGKRYEGQVRTADAQGSYGPWSPSSFFDAATAPAEPTITYPVEGGTVDQTDRVDWIVSAQDAYEVVTFDETDTPIDSAFDESAGAATTRTQQLTFPVNNVSGWRIDVRVREAGLWSPWASVGVNVAYTPPVTPEVTLTADPSTGSINVGIVNPPAETGEPAVVYNEVYIDDATGDGETRRATDLPPNTHYRYMTPRAGVDYAPLIRVVAVGENETTSSSI